MRGKYSPTVSVAYATNEKWWVTYAEGQAYDPEGYDSYGYNVDGIDRAGNNEDDYISDDDEFGCNFAYEQALSDWSFDGTRPTC